MELRFLICTKEPCGPAMAVNATGVEMSSPSRKNLAQVATLTPHTMAVRKILPPGTQIGVTVCAGRSVPNLTDILCALAIFKHYSLFSFAFSHGREKHETPRSLECVLFQQRFCFKGDQKA